MKSATVADLGGGFLAWPLTCSPRAFRQYWPRARQEDSPRPRTAPSEAQQPGTAGPLAIRHFTNSSSSAVQPVRLVIQPRFLQCFIQRHSSGNHALQCSRTPDKIVCVQAVER